MRTIIIKGREFPLLESGWGNGYVIIPTGHKLHGMSYDDIENKFDIQVHGGLTFGELLTENWVDHWPELNADDVGSWMVGFDTCHYRDSIWRWPKEAVKEEADNLMKQLLAL